VAAPLSDTSLQVLTRVHMLLIVNIISRWYELKNYQNSCLEMTRKWNSCTLIQNLGLNSKTRHQQHLKIRMVWELKNILSYRGNQTFWYAAKREQEISQNEHKYWDRLNQLVFMTSSPPCWAVPCFWKERKKKRINWRDWVNKIRFIYPISMALNLFIKPSCCHIDSHKSWGNM